MTLDDERTYKHTQLIGLYGRYRNTDPETSWPDWLEGIGIKRCEVCDEYGILGRAIGLFNPDISTVIYACSLKSCMRTAKQNWSDQANNIERIEYIELTGKLLITKQEIAIDRTILVPDYPIGDGVTVEHKFSIVATVNHRAIKKGWFVYLLEAS